MRLVNGRPIRERGGVAFRPRNHYPKGHPANYSPDAPKASATALWDDAGNLRECSEANTETVDTHLIPRRSLTSRLHLRLFPVQTETTDQKARVRATDGSMVEVTNPIVTWRSDRTLLLKGKPDQLERLKVVRVTSHTKTRRYEFEGPAVIEISGDIEDL